MNSPQRERFLKSYIAAKAYRKDLLERLIEKLEKEDKVDPSKVPTHYGNLGDIELDIDFLEKLLNIQEK